MSVSAGLEFGAWLWTWLGPMFYTMTWEDIFATCMPCSQGIGGIPPGYVGC